jgi:hypothetical protein
MKKIAVSETILTAAGLMRPGIPYALDLSKDKHAQAAEYLLAEGGVGVELTDDEAAALMASGAAHYPDDVAAPVLSAAAEAEAAAAAEAEAAAAAEAEAAAAAEAEAAAAAAGRKK